ncbi:hypothetical protein A33M_1254 [Rhodovulum sp. PH10]|nr:hypothetical protein A33M_1254 [Rhodovulum sp. PH10]
MSLPARVLRCKILVLAYRCPQRITPVSAFEKPEFASQLREVQRESARPASVFPSVGERRCRLSVRVSCDTARGQ